jgi:hypothetical protein
MRKKGNRKFRARKKKRKERKRKKPRKEREIVFFFLQINGGNPMFVSFFYLLTILNLYDL